jgi:hypothetical protein
MEFIRFIVMAGIFLAVLSSQAQTTNTEPVTNSIAKMPEVTVTSTAESRPGWLKEEQFVGPYNQPEWTTARRFAGTRVYLQQLPWEMGVEQWVRFRHYPDGSTQTRFQEEFEIGLPYRFQFDLYETWVVTQNRKVLQDEISGELRYALADWGKIPLNPTLYFEYAQHSQSEPNTVEGKILLGTDLASHWHWGLNLICEQELSGSENTELAVNQGISYSLIDEKLGAGIEMEYSHVSQESPKNTFLIGPSFQWRPTTQWHVDLTPLFGCTHNSPEVEAYLVIGFDFGLSKSNKEQYTPSSLKSH